MFIKRLVTPNFPRMYCATSSNLIDKHWSLNFLKKNSSKKAFRLLVSSVNYFNIGMKPVESRECGIVQAFVVNTL